MDRLDFLWEPDKASPLEVARMQQFPECYFTSAKTGLGDAIKDLSDAFVRLKFALQPLYRSLQDIGQAAE